MVRFRTLLAPLLMAVAALAQQRPMTVAELTGFVKSEIKFKRDDRATADFLLKRIKLTQRLEDRAVEDLQGQGAGPKTVAALRKLSEESAGLAAPPPPEIKAPAPVIPPPDSIEQAETLAAIKEYALGYTSKLPNYICTQVTRRHIDPTGSGYRPYGDVIQEQLTFFDRKESYKVTMINGHSVTNVDHNRLGGVVSNGEFGSMLHNIFNPESEAQFDWDHWATLRGKRMYVFAFHIAREHGYSMYHGESKREYVSAYQGLVYADHESKAVMRIKMDCVGIPADFPVKEVGLTLDYEPTKIVDQSFTLPYHMELRSKVDNASTKNEADYKLYRVFSSEATITFATDDPVPEDKLKEEPAKPDAKPPMKKKQ